MFARFSTLDPGTPCDARFYHPLSSYTVYNKAVYSYRKSTAVNDPNVLESPKLFDDWPTRQPRTRKHSATDNKRHTTKRRCLSPSPFPPQSLRRAALLFSRSQMFVKQVLSFIFSTHAFIHLSCWHAVCDQVSLL